MKTPFYLDANVFIFAALSSDRRGEKSRNILKKVILGEISAVTCSLTIDEVVWKLWQETKDRTIAINEGLKMMQFENLTIVSVDGKTMKSALELMSLHVTLKPRDAIHLAVALDEGISTIISDDADFDHIKGIKRTALDD